MIYLFSGDDSKNKLESYEKFIKTFPAGSETIFINRNDFDPFQIESLISGAGLFFSKSRVVFLNFFDYAETRDFIQEKLDSMGQSENDFIFLEGKLNKAILDVFKKINPKRLELNVFLLPKEKLEKFDNWKVPNAFLAKDKLNLWIYFRQALDKGVIMEELIGVLFWKIKDTLVKENFSKFSEAQLKDFASRLSYLLPKARKEGRDAEAVFEQFLLEAF